MNYLHARVSLPGRLIRALERHPGTSGSVYLLRYVHLAISRGLDLAVNLELDLHK